MSTLAIILIAVASLLIIAGLVSSFLSWRWGAAVSYPSLWALYYAPGFTLPGSLMTFWGIATLIALGINYMLPFQVATSRMGVPYMAGGALCGGFIGLITALPGALICGSAVGALCGAIAYSRTPRGHAIDFPSTRFFNYVLAKGLPIVVIMSISGLAATAIYQFFTLPI